MSLVSRLLGQLYRKRARCPAEGCNAPRPAGHMLWRGSKPASKLSVQDYGRLLECLGRARVVPFPALADAGGNGRGALGLRLDFWSGLTDISMEMASLEREAGVVSMRCFSLISAGDFCVFSEGRGRVAPEACPALRILGEGPNVTVGFLNELAEAFFAIQSCPWAFYEEAAEALARRGIRVEHFATGFQDPVADGLDLLLLHKETVRLGTLESSGFGFTARELETPHYERTRVSKDVDFVERILLPPRHGSPALYSPRLRREVAPVCEVHLEQRLDVRVNSTDAGWLVTEGGAGRILDTAELAAFLPEASSDKTVAVICQPEHFRAAARRSHGQRPDSLRLLPYPFHHYLAVNSDIDWTTGAQQESISQELNGRLRLPVASSFYLEAHGRARVAAFREETAGQAEASDTGCTPDSLLDVVRWHHAGALDTFHSWVDTMCCLTLQERDGLWSSPAGSALGCMRGLLVTACGPINGNRIDVSLRGRGAQDEFKVTVTPGPAGQSPDVLGRFQAFYPFDRSTCARLLLATEIVCRWSADASPPDTLTMEAVSFSPQQAAAEVEVLQSLNVMPLLFTTHGGGDNVRRLANLRTPAAAERDPESAAHDFDQPASPLHLAGSLRKLGVRFFSPIGAAGTRELTRIDELVQPMRLKDGTAAYGFRRFISNRFSELGFPAQWAYGKNAASASAVAFQIHDLLQRLHWEAPGSGAILYTHLGHNVGDQDISGTGWSAEVHAAFEHLANLFHHPGVPGGPEMRIWVGPAASMLLYAAVRRGLAAHLRVEGDEIDVEPWRDEGLGLTVPDLERFGTKLLHGCTVYVPDAGRARLRVAGHPFDCLTRNGPDETGRESVTVVDDSAPRMLLVPGRHAAGADVAADPESGLAVLWVDAAGPETEVVVELPPVPLLSHTHWTFEMPAECAGALVVSLQDDGGRWFTAAPESAPDRDWTLRKSSEPGLWRRQVLAFAITERGWEAAFRPQGSIRALRVRLRGERRGRLPVLRGLCLLRANPALVERSAPKVLTGRVHPAAEERLPAGLRVRVEERGQVRECPVSPEGGFLIAGLPHGCHAVCELVHGDRISYSVRGRVAPMFADLCDWDFHLPPKNDGT